MLIKLELFRRIDWWFGDCADQTTIQFCAVVHVFHCLLRGWTLPSAHATVVRCLEQWM